MPRKGNKELWTLPEKRIVSRLHRNDGINAYTMQMAGYEALYKVIFENEPVDKQHTLLRGLLGNLVARKDHAKKANSQDRIDFSEVEI